MEFIEVLQDRRSVRIFDTEAKISDAELKALFDDVMLTPSSFNLQHSRFVVTRDQGLLDKLRELSFNQKHVADCSATILVCGKLDAHDDAEEIYRDAPEAVAKQAIGFAKNFYATNEQMQRDEAMRSGSLASMTLMLAARNRGWDTCPMIGYDQDAVAGLLKLPDNIVPVMMIVLGKKIEDAFDRGHRFGATDVVRLETIEGPGLEG